MFRFIWGSSEAFYLVIELYDDKCVFVQTYFDSIPKCAVVCQHQLIQSASPSAVVLER